MIHQNAVKISNGTETIYLASLHSHDYQAITFNDGSYFAIDGGCVCPRFVGDVPKGYTIDDFTLTSESLREDIEQKAVWGTLGKAGRGPLRFFPISELEQDHVEAIWKDYGERLAYAQKIAVKKRLGIK